jgi:hypothetical protein
MPVPRQPRHVRRPHRIRDTHPPEPPSGQLACLPGGFESLRVPRLDPVIRTHVDHRGRTISHPGEQIRRVTPGPTRTITPAQPERLRRDRDDLRVKIQQHHMIAFKPGLVSHMRACSHRPPQARQMPLTPSPPEPADRTKLRRSAATILRHPARPARVITRARCPATEVEALPVSRASGGPLPVGGGTLGSISVVGCLVAGAGPAGRARLADCRTRRKGDAQRRDRSG